MLFDKFKVFYQLDVTRSLVKLATKVFFKSLSSRLWVLKKSFTLCIVMKFMSTALHQITIMKLSSTKQFIYYKSWYLFQYNLKAIIRFGYLKKNFYDKSYRISTISLTPTCCHWIGYVRPLSSSVWCSTGIRPETKIILFFFLNQLEAYVVTMVSGIIVMLTTPKYTW